MQVCPPWHQQLFPTKIHDSQHSILVLPRPWMGHYIIPFRSCAFNLLQEIFLKSATFKLNTLYHHWIHLANGNCCWYSESLCLAMTLLPDARCTLIQLAKSLFYFPTERTVNCSYWRKSYNNILLLTTSFSVLNQHHSGLYPPPFRLRLWKMEFKVNIYLKYMCGFVLH